VDTIDYLVTVIITTIIYGNFIKIYFLFGDIFGSFESVLFLK